MSPAKRRGMADFLEQIRQTEDDDTTATEPGPDTTAAASPAPMPSVPLPYAATGDGALDDREREHLAACEAALDALRLAFWAGGKALQVIRDGRLYRAAHHSFEEYCADRWDMSRRQADRLIAAWPLAEKLRPIGLGFLNEGQIRELLPLADRHGQDAAVAVYQAVAETDGVRVTATILDEVVRILPPGEWDREQAVQQIRAYLAGELEPPEDPDVDPATVWEAEAERLRATVRRVITRPAWRTAARQHPDQARAVIAELRELLNDAERATEGHGSD